MIKLDLHHFDTVTSTNDLLKEAAISGCPSGTMYVADSQTKGRGRMGRSFYSPTCTGLYMSFLLRQADIKYDINLLTAQVAVAVSNVLDSKFGLTTGIKWVNDVYLDGLKVSGILSEGVFVGTEHSVVVGIGVNLNTSTWPDEIANKAGSICSESLSWDKRKVLAEDIFNKVLETTQNPDSNWLETYNERSILTGKTVEIYKIADGDDHFSARVLGIDENAHLIVENTAGQVLHISSGEALLKQNL